MKEELTFDELKSRLAGQGYNFKALYDLTNTCAYALDAESTPCSIVIKDRYAVAKAVGNLKEAALNYLVDTFYSE